MGEISFSRPEGRIRLQYPDSMSLDDLAATVGLHISICKAAKEMPYSPQNTGQKKVTLRERDQ